MTAGNTNVNQTGNGAVLTAPGMSAHIFSIGEYTQQANPIQDSDLSNATFESFVPGDLIDPGMVDVEIGYTGPPPALNVLGTITISFPKLSGAAGVGAILTGSGFIHKASTPQAQNGSILKSKIGIRFDGKAVVPAWTGTP